MRQRRIGHNLFPRPICRLRLLNLTNHGPRLYRPDIATNSRIQHGGFRRTGCPFLKFCANAVHFRCLFFLGAGLFKWPTVRRDEFIHRLLDDPTAKSGIPRQSACAGTSVRKSLRRTMYHSRSAVAAGNTADGGIWT